METLANIKTSEKVKAFIASGFKKRAIAEKIGLSRPTFDSRLKDNCWKDPELDILRDMGII